MIEEIRMCHYFRLLYFLTILVEVPFRKSWIKSISSGISTLKYLMPLYHEIFVAISALCWIGYLNYIFIAIIWLYVCLFIQCKANNLCRFRWLKEQSQLCTKPLFFPVLPSFNFWLFINEMMIRVPIYKFARSNTPPILKYEYWVRAL